MARPKKEFDKTQFEKLCSLQCTQEEICNFFECCEDTLNAWCKRTYRNEKGKQMNFSEVFKQKRGGGKVSLRRMQWRLAEKNATMSIWLGKQYLNQSDDNKKEEIQKENIDTLSSALIKLADKLESDEIND